MQTFDEADLAELAQVAREERLRKEHPELYERKPCGVTDDCIVSDDVEGE